MEGQQPPFTSPEECTWWFLACLPYCPSKDDIAHEAHYLSDIALPYYDGDDEVEEFILDDSCFGKIQTIIRNRDPKAIFNTPPAFCCHLNAASDIRLSSQLPFPSETGTLDFCSVGWYAYEEKPEINFTRINVRQQAQESVQNHMKYKDLSALFQLPHELFLQTLSDLHPIDLHALRRVNREFRSFLSSPPSNTIWRRSFASSANPSTPLCPVDVNGWEWARLLFGSPLCDNCQCTHDYVNPDAAIRMRLCSWCFSYRLMHVDDEDVPIQVVEQIGLVHDLICRTFCQGRPINPSYTDPDHFIKADFDDVLQQYTRLQDNIDKRVDGAVVELERYKTFRRAYVETQLKHVRECNNWLIEIDRYYRSKIQRRFDYQLTLIRKHLRQDGFKDIDIAHADHQLRNHLSQECDPQNSYHHGNTTRFTTLTRSNWRKTRHGFCEAVEHCARLRIQEERKRLVERTIQEFKKTTTPISWCYWPPRHVLHGKQPFSNILNPDIKYRNNSRLEAACERGKALLQSFIDEWLSDVKRYLQSFCEVDFFPDTDPVDLAVSVFQCLFCSRGHQFVGWEDVVIHLRDHPSHQSDYSRISFSYPGCNTVCTLLRLLNLDSSLTLAVDMDERDDRFVCLVCGISSRYALNWREAVKHQQIHEEQS
ncbi:hypothetical protein E1B28_004704 [Marasmius oreades]|nr:uncharacterized protein E1B28_004704 [Marasmius oreades]KAG7097353.1 hypothetical protein E1B28_004704 [Marasmius oreades]